MNQSELILPLFSMVFLTLLVTLYLGVSNALAVLSKEVHIKHLKLFNRDEIPKYLTTISQHYKNLFELPILFYTWIGLLLILNQWTQIDVYLAWIFVLSRYVHSFIRVPNNKVHLRFYIFLMGFTTILICWIRVGLNLI
ncbi:MAG: MAPEG family protein [Candidatus Marinimicrobia bacterium]|nr:MAPEG family protein [Candidatus Neomarinimicrobiota bacterium]